MTSKELRAAMRRATLDAAVKMLELAFVHHTEADEPTEEERAAIELIRGFYDEARHNTATTNPGE